MPAPAPATIAELARRSGIDVAPIRLYEEMGLVAKPPRRGRSGDAAHHQEHLDRLIFIKRARDELTARETTLKNFADACPRMGSRSNCVILAALSRPTEC